MFSLRFFKFFCLFSAAFVASLGNAVTTEPQAHRSFAELIQNTKEASSFLLRNEAPLEIFPETRPDLKASVANAFSEGIHRLDPWIQNENRKAEQLCEIDFLSSLQLSLHQNHLSSTPLSVREALIIARRSNLIDDVILLPLLAAHPAWSELHIPSVSPGNPKRSYPCPTIETLETVASARAEFGRKTKLRHLIRHAQNDKGTDADSSSDQERGVWVEALLRSGFHETSPYTFGTAVVRMLRTKDRSPRAVFPGTSTKVASKKSTRSWSNRIALYAKYDDRQINALSNAWKGFTENIDPSTTAELRIQYADGRPDLVYPVEGNEQYRMSAKLLHLTLNELSLSGAFSGKRPTFDEMILASLETGFLHGEELNAALAVDDLWNPKLTQWQKIGNFAKKYGTPALILLPSGTGIWASLGITLIESFFGKEKAAPADERGISLF